MPVRRRDSGDDDASGDGQNTVKGGDAMRAEEIRPVDLTTGAG